jgi:hypothetical protein
MYTLRNNSGTVTLYCFTYLENHETYGNSALRIKCILFFSPNIVRNILRSDKYFAI